MEREPIQLPLPLEGATIEIPLTKGHVSVVDAVDADLSKYKWIARVAPTNIYAYRIGWVPETKGRLSIQQHRVILGRVIGRSLKGDELVDHIDGNGLNNRRDNLRVATSKQNARNSRKQSNNTSGFKGVSWHKTKQKWQAHITIDWKLKHLGLFETPEEAYEAYCEAALRFHGEFACFD